MNSELKSQHDLKLNPQAEPVQLCSMNGSRKTLPTHHHTALSNSHVELKGDKPSSPYNLITKRKRVAQLIGKKCLVWCKINTVKTQALWDTGAQVSIMSEAWKSQNLPDAEICPISELLSDDDILDVAQKSLFRAGYQLVSVYVTQKLKKQCLIKYWFQC